MKTQPEADLDISATKTGFLPPRMRTREISLLDRPVAGTMVYNTDSGKLVFFTGSGWKVADAKSAGVSSEGSDRSQAGVPVLYVNSSGSIGFKNTEPRGALDLSKGTLGFLPSKMTADEIRKIKNPVGGTMVYNTTDHVVQFYNGRSWVASDNRVSNPNAGDAYHVTGIRRAGGDAIRDVPSPAKGMIAFNTDENKLVIYNGNQWLFTDGTPMDYQVGDVLADNSIVFYIKGGKAKGSHGLTVKKEVFKNVFYPFEFGFTTKNTMISTPDGLDAGKKNTQILWNNKSEELVFNYEYKLNWHLIDNIFGSKTREVTQQKSSAELTRLYAEQKARGKAKSDLASILSALNTGGGQSPNNITWYIPTIEELQKLRLAYTGNTSLFNFLAPGQTSGLHLFFSSRRELKASMETTDTFEWRDLYNEDSRTVKFKWVDAAKYYLLSFPPLGQSQTIYIYDMLEFNDPGKVSTLNAVFIREF